MSEIDMNAELLRKIAELVFSESAKTNKDIQARIDAWEKEQTNKQREQAANIAMHFLMSDKYGALSDLGTAVDRWKEIYKEVLATIKFDES